VITLANSVLGPGGFSVKSVAYREVFDYYRAADVFALASLEEGFGRVYLEALMHGLPVIAHRHPVAEYVIGDNGYLGDLTRQGELAKLVHEVISEPKDQARMLRRWSSVRDRFSWSALAPSYAAMFRAVAKSSAQSIVGNSKGKSKS